MSVIKMSAFGALTFVYRGLCPQDPRDISSQMKKDHVDG